MQSRYSSVNQVLHWVTVIGLFAVLPLAWVMVNAKAGSPLSGTLFNWHKTVGFIVLLVTVFRIGWRFVDPPPPYPPQVAAWDRRLAHAVYWLFFFILLWMPITGILTSAYGGHQTLLFNLFPTPQILPKDDGLSKLFAAGHLLGQWAVYGLILLHLTGVAFQLIWARTGVLGRMLPADAAEPAGAAVTAAGRTQPAPSGRLVVAAGRAGR